MRTEKKLEKAFVELGIVINRLDESDNKERLQKAQRYIREVYRDVKEFEQ